MVIKSGRANLQRGAESVGGKLELDGRLLRFTPHAANAQRAPQTIEVVDIKRLERTWTRFLGRIPLTPNAMRISMRNDETYVFTVRGRKAWIAALAAAQAETPKG